MTTTINAEAALLSEMKKVLEMINECSSAITFDQLTNNELYDIAKQKSLLKQLHSIYGDLKPTTSKVRKDYQGQNFKANFEAETAADAELLTSTAESFIPYFVNFGEKHLLIERLTLTSGEESHLKSILDEITHEDLVIEKEDMLHSESQTKELKPLSIIAYQKDSKGNHTFLLHENISTTSLETPSPTMLSDAGKQIIGQMFLEKRTIKNSFHRIVISSDLKHRLILIDPTPLHRRLSASDKAASCLALLHNNYEIEFGHRQGAKPIYFFEAIQKIYSDPAIGRITGGFFITSTGSTFTNTTTDKEVDLRKDPYHKAGEKGHDGELSFSKIQVNWDSPGEPKASFNGSTEMFTTPKTSLPDIEIIFSTEDKKHGSMLDSVLTNATWN